MPDVEPVTSATLPSRIMCESSFAPRSSRAATTLDCNRDAAEHYGSNRRAACGSATSAKAAISRRYRPGGGFGGGGFGGGGLGCLLPLIASRFGIGGVVVLVIGYFLLSSLGGLVAAEAAASGRRRTAGAPAGQSNLDPADQAFHAAGARDRPRIPGPSCSRRRDRYTPTNCVFYSEATNRAAAPRSRRWGRSTARQTRTSISTRNSSTSCRSASARPAISRRPM